MLSSLKLPACERCRKKKVRCDTAPPKCSPCSKSSASCIIVDPSTQERYSREQLHELQQKLERLEAKHRVGNVASPAEDNASSPSRSKSQAHYVGDGSGLGMFRRGSSKVHGASAQEKSMSSVNLYLPWSDPKASGHELPSVEAGRFLIDRYMSHSHLHHPFLSRQTVLETFNRVYSQQGSDSDLYRIFMICAISGVTLFRKGFINEHPYGYFRSAWRLASQVEMVGSVEGVQNLLLIARFAMYYHIDCSIWDVSRICMRQCIELGLHQNPSLILSPMEEQARRNLFWDCYVHDRYSSGILGRPYAIAEQDIGVDLPLMGSENEILQSPCRTLNEMDLSHFTLPNESCVAVFVIRLRRLTTQIHIRFFSSRSNDVLHPRSVSSAGQVQLDLDRFLEELEVCRNSAPLFSQPQSLYERAEWYDFLVEKDKLSLIRGAIAHLPVNGLNPTRRLLRMGLTCATRVIEIYSDLFQSGYITWTRSYFQILFTAGLSIMYCLSIMSSGVEDTSQDANHDKASQALRTCAALLTRLIAEMPDARHFSVAFESLVRQYTDRDRQRTKQVSDESNHARSGNQVQEPILEDTAMTELHQNVPPLSQFTEQDLFQQNSSAFELDLGNFEDWSMHPAHADNLLGQMEADLGHYAWGGFNESNTWEQYFMDG